MNTPQNETFVPTEIIEAYPGLFQEWYAERQIVVYRLKAVTQGTLDAWSSLVETTVREWNLSKPYLALHDLSAPGVSMVYASLTNYDMLNIGITRAGKIRVESLLNERPSLIARVAISFNITLSGHIGKSLLNHYTDKHPSVQYKSYYSREKSFQWLTSHFNEQRLQFVGTSA